MTDEEIHARVAAPDTSQWIGRRDHTLLIVAIKIGLQVSELTALCCQDVHVGPGTCDGWARVAKQCCTPLTG